jgi:hypothetical protein
VNGDKLMDGRSFWNAIKIQRIFFLVVPVLLAIWVTTSSYEKFAALEFVACFFLVFYRVFIEVEGTLNFSKSRTERAFSLKLLLGYSISIIIMFAAVYKYFGLIVDGHIIEPSWTEGLYFSIVTWTTLGYGDIQPVEPMRLVAAFEAYIGYIYMGLLAGGIASILFSKNCDT